MTSQEVENKEKELIHQMKLQEERVTAMKKHLEEKEQGLVEMMDKVQQQLQILAEEREVKEHMKYFIHYYYLAYRKDLQEQKNSLHVN